MPDGRHGVGAACCMPPPWIPRTVQEHGFCLPSPQVMLDTNLVAQPRLSPMEVADAGHDTN
jgi:hypothetical protein